MIRRKKPMKKIQAIMLNRRRRKPTGWHRERFKIPPAGKETEGMFK